MEEITKMLSVFWSNYDEAIIVLATWVLVGLILDRIVIFVGTTHKLRLPDTLRAFFVAIESVFLWAGIVLGLFFAWDTIRTQLRPDADWSKYYRAFAIIVITAFISRIVTRLIKEYSRKKNSRLPSSTIFTNIASSTIWIIGLGFMLASINVQLTPIITAFGIGGVAIGLALQPTLDNLFSGIQILASEQILPNDFVRLATGEEGYVEDVTWRNTTVRRPSGDIVIVPNSVLSKTHVINFSRSDRPYTLNLLITIPEDCDFEKASYEAKMIANKVVDESPLTFKSHIPVVRLHETGIDGSILKVTLPVLNYSDRDTVKAYYMEIIKDRYQEIQIPLLKITQAL